MWEQGPLQAERARKREALLAATETDLAKIAAATGRARRPLRGKEAIALRVDRVLRRRKVAKHFTTAITDQHFSYARNHDSITKALAHVERGCPQQARCHLRGVHPDQQDGDTQPGMRIAVGSGDPLIQPVTALRPRTGRRPPRARLPFCHMAADSRRTSRREESHAASRTL